MIYECPTVKYIFEYIRENITKQAYITPIEVIITGNRCLKVLDSNGIPLDDDMQPVTVHVLCILIFTNENHYAYGS